MKLLTFVLLFIMIHCMTAQTAPQFIDLTKYSGKWFVVGVIPTRFDADWNDVTETYTLNEKGKIEIFTTYIKNGKTKSSYVTSKGFPNKKAGNVTWKVQFIWPFRADYLIEEIADDYSYTVVGHPKKKFLYIMTRTGKMDNRLYSAIVTRFSEKGYDTAKLKKMMQSEL